MEEVHREGAANSTNGHGHPERVPLARSIK